MNHLPYERKRQREREKREDPTMHYVGWIGAIVILTSPIWLLFLIWLGDR